MHVELKMVGGKLVGREFIAYPQDALSMSAGLKREAPILDGQIVGTASPLSPDEHTTGSRPMTQPEPKPFIATMAKSTAKKSLHVFRR